MNIGMNEYTRPSLDLGDLLAAQDHREVDDRGDDRDERHDRGQVLGVHHTGQHQQSRSGRPRPRRRRRPTGTVARAAAGSATWCASSGRFLRPARTGSGRSPCRRRPAPKPQWKPSVSCSQAGQQRAEQRAEVDAHVEDGEAGVAAVVLRARTASRPARWRWPSTPPEPKAIRTRPTPSPGMPGQQGQRDVPQHDHDGGVEQRPSRSPGSGRLATRRGWWTGTPPPP